MNVSDDYQFGKGTLERFADSVWTAATSIRFAGIWFPHVMTVIRLTDGRLLLHSPCQPSAALIDEIAKVGSVDHVVAPNWFHDLYLQDYRGLYPSANIWGPRVLQRQKPAIIDHVMEQGSQPPWFAEMPHCTLSGLLTFDESIFFHTPSKTLIVADLLANVSVNHRTPALTRLAYRITGIDGRLIMLPYLRWFSPSTRRSLRIAAQQINEWDPARLIVGHGAPITSIGAAHLAYALGTRPQPCGTKQTLTTTARPGF